MNWTSIIKYTKFRKARFGRFLPGCIWHSYYRFTSLQWMFPSFQKHCCSLTYYKNKLECDFRFLSIDDYFWKWQDRLHTQRLPHIVRCSHVGLLCEENPLLLSTFWLRSSFRLWRCLAFGSSFDCPVQATQRCQEIDLWPEVWPSVLARTTRLFRATSALVQEAHNCRTFFCSSGLPSSNMHISYYIKRMACRQDWF